MLGPPWWFRQNAPNLQERILILPPYGGVAARSAGFPTCCITDFQVGRAREVSRPAGRETCDTADLEVCATVVVSTCAQPPAPARRNLVFENELENRSWAAEVAATRRRREVNATPPSHFFMLGAERRENRRRGRRRHPSATRRRNHLRAHFGFRDASCCGAWRQPAHTLPAALSLWIQEAEI